MLLHLSSLALALVGWSCAVFAAPSATRQNVLVIIADDLGFSDLGCYGGEISTPNLDRLAADGMRFTQFYNCAVCVTTRTAFYSGFYPRLGKDAPLTPKIPTIGELVHAAGYRTALFGKWHLGGERPKRAIDRGFDEYYGVLSGCCHYFNPSMPDPKFESGTNGRPFADQDKRVTKFPPGFYTTDAFSDRAIDFLRRQKSGQPFFLNLCYTAPHFPLMAPAEDIARYRGKYRDGYDAVREKRFARQKSMGLFASSTVKLSPADAKTGESRFDYDVKPWNALTDSERKREEERMEVYAAMVDRLDQGIGRVLAELEAAGLANDTVVFFFSDNGGCGTVVQMYDEYVKYNAGVPVGDPKGYELVGPAWGWAQNAPFRRFKTWTYEGGMCTPLIVRWPGVVKPGQITREVGHVVDFVPTLLELSGQTGRQKHPQMEGESLLPILRGKKAAPRRTPIFSELYGNRAVHDGNWKLVWGASDQRWELYDLTSDRTETVDLAAKFPERRSAMASQWEKWWNGPKR